GGRAYAVLFDNTLQEFDGHNWTRVPGSLLASSVDAVTTKSGSDHVFSVALDGDFWEYDQVIAGSNIYLANELNVANRITRIVDYSAGTDALGNAEVYASFQSLFGPKTLEKNNHGSANGWLTVLNGGYKSFSATDSGDAWIATTSGAVFELDQFG